MKKLILSILLSICAFVGYAQSIPNVSFPTTEPTADAYAVNITNYGTSYNNKIAFVEFRTPNSGPATINITPSGSTALGAKPMRIFDGSDWIPLASGDINGDTSTWVLHYHNQSGTMHIWKHGSGTGGGGGPDTNTSFNALFDRTKTGDFTIALADTSSMIYLENGGGPIEITIPDFSAVSLNKVLQFAFFRDMNDTVTFDVGGETVILSAANLGISNRNYLYLNYRPGNNQWYASSESTGTGGGGSGDVTKVGTPANNQVGVWTGDGTIEGTSGLTYDGSNLQLTGDIGSTGTRITKGWFTDLQVTNAITGSITGNAATVTTNANLTGDVTSSGNATTLATVNGNVGSFGSATAAGTFTVNGKGLITAAGSTTVTPAVGSITGLGTGVGTWLATPSSANLATALTDEVGTGPNGFARTTLNTQTGSYTLAASDEWKEVQMNAAGANDITLPPDATVPVGFRCTFRRLGAGTTTFLNGSGVTSTFSAGVALDAGQYNLVDIFKDAADHYEITNGSSATGAALTRTNGTYITTTLSGSMSGALNTAVDITVDLTGVVPVTLGGTGVSSSTQTYTPTLTNTTNIAASTARACQYMRVGNTVTVSGQLDIDPTTTATLTTMGISLPVASNFSTAFQAGGTAAAFAVTDSAAGIQSDATNDRVTLQYVCVDVTNHTMTFTFTYQVL